MPSVAERIAALTKSPSTRGSSKKVDNTDDEKPDGEILWHGWLHRAGAGVLASTWNKRYCVVHIAASGPLLSLYDSMSMEKLKGGRLSLTSAHLSQADDKLQLSATAADGKDAGTKVHVRLKAGSTKEAVDCAGVFQCAINGQRVPTAEEKRALSTKGSLVGGVELGGEGSTKIQSPPPKASPQKSSPADEAAAAAEAAAEKLQRQKSAEAMEAAKEAERARQIEEAKRLAGEEAAARKANQEAADKAMEVERQRRMSEGPESPSSKQASELQRKESQRAVDAAMEAERTRRVGEVVAEEITTSVQRRASIKQADIAMEMERARRVEEPAPPLAKPPPPPPVAAAAASTTTITAAVSTPVVGGGTLPLNTPVVNQLGSMSKRLGVLAKEPFPWSSSLLSSEPSDVEELAKRLEALMGFVERCADGVCLNALEGMTQRLEAKVGVAPAATGTSGKATMDALVTQLSGLVTRMEAATA